MSNVFSRLKLDPYILALLGMVLLASVLPVRGDGVVWLDRVTDAAIALLFFLYGGRLSREAVVSGLSNWRLQLLVLASTFVLFPLLGVGIGWLMKPFLSPELSLGLIFLSVLPSTVQSSIAFTSLAGGNVAAAVCAASLSNLVGMLATPLLVGVMLSAHGQGFSLDALGGIFLQLLLPFALGQALRPWIGVWLGHRRKALGYFDRGAILLVVYAAFSAGVVNGLWNQLDAGSLTLLLAANGLLLAAVLLSTTWLSRRLGFSREDEIAIVFCGSKKSLVSGIPMAKVLFAGSQVGMLVLPLMLFHQIQLMACAFIARRYAGGQ